MRWNSAAVRRLRTMGGTKDVREAVRLVVAGVLEGVHCPPTDLVAVCRKLQIDEIVDDDDTPVVGELRRDQGVLRIICATGQSVVRRRFTIAHELGHALMESSGAGAPRVGRELERLCDMLAAELLMPKAVFDAALGENPVDGLTIRRLAGAFQTSLTSTALRCVELRSVSLVCVQDGQLRWRRGSVRPNLYELRPLIDGFIDGDVDDDRVVVEHTGVGRLYRGDWIRTTGDRSGLIVLTRETNPDA